MGDGHDQRRAVFVDESKVRDYLLVAVTLPRTQLRPARTSVSALILRGQSRLHMRKESDARRRLILATIAPIDPEVTIFRAPKDGRTDMQRRSSCIRRLVESIGNGPTADVCFELDETLVRKDRQWIVEAVHAGEDPAAFTHRHETAAHEPLLALPDALGWAWAKGGDWRRRCGPVVTVVDV
ncbi:hypothetical protein KK101_16115 [Curtobacterium flaccumfaciens pv. oortii]|uniref:hypothetical protein n=1 Tax=Curtobacterium flaccumfaciens TaxID=2035 RepID=UPI001BDE25BD|nr:hypothetical protein [Curtobacterium flaccumfaciens]MBT1624220.1 hypothetical protein [Curtobacterium flaccumfaciens pv. oortii]